MKKILVIVLLIFAFGCKEDTTGPNENELVGKWKKLVSVRDIENNQYIDILIVLQFEENARFQITTESTEESLINENGTYSVMGDTLSIINNKCEDSVGEYKFEFKNNGVEFTRITDDCNYNNIINRFFLDYDELITQ